MGEEDLTEMDKAALSSAFSTLSEIRDSAAARGQYAHFYDSLAEKTRQRGHEVLVQALDRKSSS
ncbi:UNVERIFIED_ORG: hypothetical protein J2X79_003761 [Arthrobacter globiformis]|nr:hypothetical protein [Arthrobacter globiformis]